MCNYLSVLIISEVEGVLCLNGETMPARLLIQGLLDSL